MANLNSNFSSSECRAFLGVAEGELFKQKQWRVIPRFWVFSEKSIEPFLMGSELLLWRKGLWEWFCISFLLHYSNISIVLLHINSFIMEVPITYKPVHWFAHQCTVFYMIVSSVIKELIISKVRDLKKFTPSIILLSLGTCLLMCAINLHWFTKSFCELVHS